MTHDLLTQLAEYGGHTREAREPVTSSDVRERTERLRPVQPVSDRRQGWIVAVATAAAVLVLVGGTALLFRVTSSNSLVATTPPTDSFSSLTWSRVLHDEAAFDEAFDESMFSVTVGGPGLVAVGSGGGQAAVWTSVDGITWSRVPLDEAVFGRAEMHSVTVGGPGLVAVGLAYQGSAAAVWTSVDGISWSRVPHDESVFGESVFGRVEMSSVTVGGPGLVAVGFDGAVQGVRGNAVVWTSPDGISWSRVPHDAAIFGGGWVSMNSVTVGGPGLVAVGSDWMGDDKDGRATVWTSVDGISWSGSLTTRRSSAAGR